MPDNIERLAVLIEANTKSYENAMKRLQSQTDQALRGVNDNFVRGRKGAAALESAMDRAARAAGAAAVQFRGLQQNIDSSLGIRGGSAFGDRAGDIAAFGASLDALRAKYNPLFSAQQQYKATLGEINRALRVGALSENEHAVAIKATKDAFVSQVAAIRASGNSYIAAKKSAGAFGGSMTQLSFQINDVISGIAMGQRPMQIFAQQGGQIFQIWQMNRNIFTEIKEAMAAFAVRMASALGPLGLFSAGMIAAGGAAYGLYSLLKDNEPTTEKLLKEHDRLLGVIKSSYDNVTKSAANWLQQSKEVTQLQLLQQQIDLRQKLNEAIVKGLRPTVSMDIFTGKVDVLDKFRAFEDAIFKLKEGWQQGTPNVRAYVDEVARIGLLNPALRKMANELVNSVGDASKFEFTLQQIQSALKAIDGMGLTKKDKLLLDLPTANSSVNAYQSLVKATKDQIDEFKFEADHAREAGFAIDGLKKEHELLRAALKSGLPDTEATRAKIKQLSDAYQQAKASAAAAKLQADLFFERQQLGMTPGEAQIQQRLRGAGIDPASAIGQQTAAELRLNQALTETRDIARDAISGFVNDLVQGKSRAEAFAGVLQKIESKLIDMAVNNLVANALGGAAGGGGVLDGIVRSIFGGFRAGGGEVMPGKAYVVGEKRPELFVPSTSGRIIPTTGGAGSGQPIVIHNQIDARGADAAAVARLQAGLDQMHRTLPSRIAAELHRSNVRGGRA